MNLGSLKVQVISQKVKHFSPPKKPCWRKNVQNFFNQNKILRFAVDPVEKVEQKVTSLEDRVLSEVSYLSHLLESQDFSADRTAFNEYFDRWYFEKKMKQNEHKNNTIGPKCTIKKVQEVLSHNNLLFSHVTFQRNKLYPPTKPRWLEVSGNIFAPSLAAEPVKKIYR